MRVQPISFGGGYPYHLPIYGLVPSLDVYYNALFGRDDELMFWPPNGPRATSILGDHTSKFQIMAIAPIKAGRQIIDTPYAR